MLTILRQPTPHLSLTFALFTFFFFCLFYVLFCYFIIYFFACHVIFLFPHPTTPYVDYECSDNEFRCSSDGLCFEKQFLCDTIKHCSDGEDESEQMCREGNRASNLWLFCFIFLIKLIYIHTHTHTRFLQSTIHFIFAFVNNTPNCYNHKLYNYYIM